MNDETNHSRRRALQILGGVTIASLAGCSSSDGTNPTAESTETRTTAEPSTDTSTPESQSTTHDHTTTEHTATEAPASVDFEQNPEEIHPTLVEETSVPEDEVLIGFRLEDSSLPFTTEVYQAPPDAPVHATRTYETQDLGQVDLVPDQPQELDTVSTDKEDIHYGTTSVGSPLTVTLVARNDEESFEWSSWDRTGYPHDGHDEEDPTLEVACYCGGMIYDAPADGTWARVIQVTPTEDVDPGTTIALNWTSSRL